MILAETDDGIRFITQPDHAGMAGRFAERWGNDRFDSPEPTAAVLLAIHAHDDGWWPFDRRPQRTPDGTPQDFHELSAPRWIRLYRRGIDDIARIDRYAGLLVSMHGSGLRRRRYGLSPSWGETPAAFRAFVADEERRQRSLAGSMKLDPDDERLTEPDLELLDALHGRGSPTGETEDASRLWMNYRLLSALDALSLHLCATDIRESTSPDTITVNRVPTALGRPDVSVTAEAVGTGSYRLTPYPFETSPITTSVPVRRVSGSSFVDEASLLDRYYTTPTESFTFTLEGDARSDERR